MFRLILRILAISTVFWGSMAAGLEAPKEQVLLRVTGQIGVSNAGDQAHFDRPMLHALDWQEFDAYTPFTDGVGQFSGPTIASLLDRLEADGAQLRAVAVDDYAVVLDVAEVRRHGAILALEHNGAQMGIRNKGPIWIVYPQTKAQAEAHDFYAQMIWQLVELEVLPRAN